MPIILSRTFQTAIRIEASRWVHPTDSFNFPITDKITSIAYNRAGHENTYLRGRIWARGDWKSQKRKIQQEQTIPDVEFNERGTIKAWEALPPSSTWGLNHVQVWRRKKRRRRKKSWAIKFSSIAQEKRRRHVSAAWRCLPFLAAVTATSGSGLGGGPPTNPFSGRAIDKLTRTQLCNMSYNRGHKKCFLM